MTRSAPRSLCPLQTLRPAPDYYHLAHAGRFQHQHVQQAECAAADNHDRLVFFGTRHLLRVYHARERFEQRGFLERQIRGLDKRAARDDVRRQQQRVGIAAVHHPPDGRVAKIFLPMLAVETNPARRGRRRHDCVAGLERRHALARFQHDAGKLVPERHRSLPHRMSAPKSFQIGAATERASNLDQQLARARARRDVIAQFEAPRLDQQSLARMRRGDFRRRFERAHSLRSTTKVATCRSGSALGPKSCSARCARVSSSRARSIERSMPKIAG